MSLIGGRSTRNGIKAITPVEAQQSEHRQEYPDAYTGRPAYIERIIILKFGPVVACLYKKEPEYS